MIITNRFLFKTIHQYDIKSPRLHLFANPYTVTSTLADETTRHGLGCRAQGRSLVGVGEWCPPGNGALGPPQLLRWLPAAGVAVAGLDETVRVPAESGL